MIAEVTVTSMLAEGFLNILLFPPENLGEEEETKIKLHQKSLDKVEQMMALRYDNLLLVDPQRDKEALAKAGVEKPTKAEEYMTYGPRQIICRMTLEEMANERAALRAKGFNFAEKYPFIHKCTVKGSPANVWFKVFQLRVLVAKGMKSCTEDRLPIKILSQSPHQYTTIEDAELCSLVGH